MKTEMYAHKLYTPHPTQLRTSIKPAQYPRKYRKERRIGFWRAIAGGVLVVLCLSLLAYGIWLR